MQRRLQIYKVTGKINCLINMEIIKIFALQKELETLIQTIRTYNPDKVMEFGIRKICHVYNEKGERETPEE